MSELSLQFELDWLEPFDGGSPEGVTYAAIEMLVGSCRVTEVEDYLAQTLRDRVLVSAFPIARFLAENWWRLRWEPAPARICAAWRLRHCLSAVGEGYSWPNLSFASDGESIHARLRRSGDSSISPIRYLNELDHWVAIDDFERSVDLFMDTVAGRLEAMGHSQNELADLLAALRSERADVQMARWRRLEAIAGFDADEAPERFIQSLLAEGESVGWESLHELTAASRGQVLQDLASLRESLSREGCRFQIEHFADLRGSIMKESADLTLPPWMRAATAARITRQVLGLNGEVVSNRRLSQLFDIPETQFETSVPSNSPFTASSHPEGASEGRMVISKRYTMGRRFATCRLLGDLLYFDDQPEMISAATDAATARQKFQRAFAQELLCPFDALTEMLDEDAPLEDDIETAAEHFQVSPLLVRTTLVNRHLLPRDALDTVSP